MKRTVRGALCALLPILCLLLMSCAKAQPSSASFEAMDTLMTLKVYGGDPDTCEKLQSRIEALDALLDATDENSEIFRLNTEKTAAVSADTDALLRDALALCDKLGGSFDITVYPAVQAWGFLSGDYRVPDDGELQTLADHIDWRGVKSDSGAYTVPEDAAVDLGAVAKGYAADRAADILRQSGAEAAVLNLGGTVRMYGKKPDGSRFAVGVADPESPAATFGTLSCDEGVVATSGGYERYFELDGRRYIHILDPKTAKPVDNGVLSVTVVTDSGTTADALSTALFVMGLDKATEYYRHNDGFGFILLTDDDNLYLTENLAGDFTLNTDKTYTVNTIRKAL